MIVADASAVTELLLHKYSPAGQSLAKRFADREAVCAPHLLDAEIGQVIRRFVLHDKMTVASAAEVLGDFSDLRIQRFPHTGLLLRAFELRANVTVYDGIYLALAEALDALLVSCDAALAEVPGSDLAVEILPVARPTR